MARSSTQQGPTAIDAPVVVLRGSDTVLLSNAIADTVRELVADGERGLMVDEFAGGDYTIGSAVDAALTPPFLSDRRIVVMRNAARFAKLDDLTPLIDYLAAPSATTALVIVWERGPDQQQLPTPPKKLLDALRDAGGQVLVTDPPSGRGREAWLDERLADAPIILDRGARVAVVDRLGDDVAELSGLISRLEAAYGTGSTVGVDDVEPFLGEPGAVPPWELTDAIDRGDTARALERLHRMLGAGDRHPLQLMATLQTHYRRILQLDGADVADEREAADRLGLRGSTFPAKKALAQTRRLGSDGVARAIGLLAAADLDLRGARAWPPELVLEVLVARLSRLARARR